MKGTLAGLSVAILVLAAGGCATVSTPAAPAKGTIDPASGKACYECHRSKITGANVHQALAANECTPCHQVQPGDHQRDNTLFAVKDKGAKLCWECHDSLSDAKSVHPAIEAYGCIGCHAPHNSSLQHLLKDKVPDLCFGCHDKKMVQEKETSKGTDFRDGQQSLHFLHAGKANAIPCLTCHDVHASSQLHLIRPKGSKVREGVKEEVTITYTASDKGGNCTASCHDELGYERK